ncbi:helicase-associated domain-containing protein [Nonomuraea sp. NEAU-A123]|uniref:helicase-associated domain-containing protein n=1 Tax=Nonomuraea sp. NEAU-A123 TaxID=2839649 RepID=UPI001BE451F6|nr:helicase-associated domain-containing protein [Nonomuraea sp. NEAU-A123]MBT2228426.1 helicase-associated domain-containing protein [Nonomuraea sp. NEAU-A123]
MPSDALMAWLTTRTPEQLALLADRGALRVRGREPSLEDYAHLLRQDQVLARLMGFCTLPELQALGAIAWLSAQRYGPIPDDYWRVPDPDERAVSRAEVLTLLAGQDQDLRAEAQAALARLADQALLQPPHGEQCVVAPYIHRNLADGMGLGRPAAYLIARYFNAPEVHRLAAALELDKAPGREAAERSVVAFLTDPDRLHALLAKAPASATELLGRLAHEGPLIEILCFHPAGPYGSNKYVFFAGGSGHPGADWLAARGLLLPSGVPQVAELPVEVAIAVRGELRATFTPHPPQPRDLPRAEDIEPAAEAAAGTLAWQLERLLAGCAEQPLTVRKSGGVAIRDTKRLAKGIAEPETVRFLLELCFRAGLLGLLAEPAEPPANRRAKVPPPSHIVLPTRAYDRWLSYAPAQRLVPILAAWAVCRDIPLWWPDPDQTPVALTGLDDSDAVSLRYALLEALAAAPAQRAADAAPYLVAAATWHRPARIPRGPAGAQRIESTVREAALLGVIGQGALTRLGHTVLDLLRTGQAWKTPNTALSPVLTGMLPAPRTTARFQTDLTAVVAGAPEAKLAALLNTVGVRESEGHAVVWRISHASVRHALDAGHETATLITRLRAVAEGDLPQPLEYLIKDVGRTHGRMRVVRSGCCIRSDDEALLAELVHAKPLRALGLRLIAPTVLISASPERETMASLRAAGYAPALEAETGATLVEQPSSRRAP